MDIYYRDDSGKNDPDGYSVVKSKAAEDVTFGRTSDTSPLSHICSVLSSSRAGAEAHITGPPTAAQVSTTTDP